MFHVCPERSLPKVKSLDKSCVCELFATTSFYVDITIIHHQLCYTVMPRSQLRFELDTISRQRRKVVILVNDGV